MLLRLYPLALILQLFCLYHAFKSKADQKWFWIIIVFPFIGSLFYVYEHFYTRNNIDNIKEEVKGTLIHNYTLDKLEEKVKFSNTYSNKLELANEHLKFGNINRAIEVYESCNSGAYENDTHLLMKLVESHYINKNYNKVIEYGSIILEKKEFSNSPAKTALAWSNYRVGNTDEAEQIFRAMDKPYSNYENRLEYAYFLDEAKMKSECTAKVKELISEIQAMDSHEKRINKEVIKDIKYFYRQI